MQKRYKGLANIGATCYMNSLLQTLFMTPEFRYGIYKWNYNSKIHPKQSDSIIFQLQKLFAKLQIDFPGQVTPKQLVKSFQWQDQQAQMQQDIQEFNRLLFEALQKSLSTKSEKYIHQNFVKDYFEGELIHYTKCHQCLNQSAREQFFQDLIITVKNIYEKVYNHKLQLGLQRYLKPQILDENNLYDCEKCGKKTKASRGARFIKMPSLLNIIFQRFNFNYFTMERQKVNDRVEFPFVLNFNDYIDGYDQIPNKINQDSSEYFKTANNPINGGLNGKRTAPNLSSRINNKPTAVKKSTMPSVAGKTTTKPSASTKGFLAEMRKRKKLNQTQNEDLFFVNGTAVASQAKSEVYTALKNETAKMIEQPKNSQNTNNHVLGSQKKQNCIKQNKTQNQQHTIGHNQLLVPQLPANLPPPPPPLDLIPADLSIPYKLPQQSATAQTIESELQNKKLQSQKLQQQKQQQLLQLQTKNKDLIQTYLKQGPLVYELYAVLVHNGTANHGHYYCYIKSFEDDKWYCFNDERVTLINVLEIEKTFGNANSNAYALYYRMIDSAYTENQIKKELQTPLNKLRVQLPTYITEKLEAQKHQIKQKQSLKMQNLQNLIVLKICYQLFVKQIQVYKFNSLDLVVQKARELFSIPSQVKTQNVRLRMFNPSSETKLQTFGGRSHLSLQELKIWSYKSLLLQVKADNQQFQEYEVGTVFVRFAFIQQNKNLNSLDESHLKLHKISIKKNQTIQGVLELIKQKYEQVLSNSLKRQELCLIKRHQNNDETIHEIISNKENLSKNIDDLTILENEILFVQPQSENLVWPMEFQNQIYRISIRYNKPGTAEYQSYLTDSRIKVGHLKSELCLFLEVNPEDTLMRWGTKSGREIKEMDITLKEARFINGTQVYFDFGIPAQPGEIRIQLFLATDASPQVFNRLHQFEYLADVPISGGLKASEVKQRFIHVVKKIKGIQLKRDQFRIRQRVSDKIGKIYRQKPLKEQQLIEKRQIAIQLVPDQGIDLKDFSIYFRVWDQQNWQLSDKIQLVINKNTTVKELSELLLNNPKNKIIQDPNLMCICRILSIHKFNIIDLTQMEWFSMDQNISVIGEPMFVNTDGLLYIIKNDNQEPRELTKQEQQKFGGTIKPIIVKNKPRVPIKQAKSMKIKVIQKQIQPEEFQNIVDTDKKQQEANS